MVMVTADSFALVVGKTYGGGAGIFRPMTLDEAKHLHQGARVWFKAVDGTTAKQCRVTSVQTWKRRPDVVVRVKFGMYEHHELRNEAITNLLVRTDE